MIGLGLAIMVAGCSDARASVDPPPQTPPETTPLTAPAPSGVEVADTVYRVLARVCDTGDLALATGVAVSGDLVATVAHSLESAESVEIENRNGRREPAEVAWLDLERDVALLRLPTPTSSWLALGQGAEGDTASIVTIANLGTAQDDGSAEEEAADLVIEELETEILREVDITLDGEGARAGFELQGEIELGDSGSPVVNPQNELVAIVFGSNRSEPRGWAVSAKEIEAALAQQEGGLVTLDC